MAMGGADANLGIDSEIGVDAESRCRNSKWTKNSSSGVDSKNRVGSGSPMVPKSLIFSCGVGFSSSRELLSEP